MTSHTTDTARFAARSYSVDPLTNRLDSVVLSKIVEVRDALIAMQNRGEKVYRLESGTPAFNLFPEVAEAIVRAVRDNKTFYTEATGIAPLREAICEKLARKNGVTHNVTPANVFVGQGGMGTLFCAMHAVTDPGDTILTPSPVWISITNIAKLTGANVCELPLHESLGFNWDFEELAATIEQYRPKLVVIVNPNNPTGGIFPRTDVNRLLELVKSHKFYVIEDLAYEDIVYDSDNYTMLTAAAHATDDPDIYNRFVPCFSMSKSQNYSGLRIGYAHIGDPSIAGRFRKALLYTTNGVNSLAQWGAVEALNPRHDSRLREMTAEYQQRRAAMYDGLMRSGVFHLPGAPKGSFFLFPHIDRAKLAERMGTSTTVPSVNDPTPLGEWMAHHLLKSGIGSIAGHHFGSCATDYIRFSYTCSLEDCREVGEKLVGLFGGNN